MSGCRDLIFHVQEHRFTLPRIASVLAELDLDFVGFEWPDDDAPARYRARFPDDRALSDLAHWHEFESSSPRHVRADVSVLGARVEYYNPARARQGSGGATQCTQFDRMCRAIAVGLLAVAVVGLRARSGVRAEQELQAEGRRDGVAGAADARFDTRARVAPVRRGRAQAADRPARPLRRAGEGEGRHGHVGHGRAQRRHGARAAGRAEGRLPCAAGDVAATSSRSSTSPTDLRCCCVSSP